MSTAVNKRPCLKQGRLIPEVDPSIYCVTCTPASTQKCPPILHMQRQKCTILHKQHMLHNCFSPFANVLETFEKI